MKGCIVERSPGHFAVIVDDFDTGKRKRKWRSVRGTREEAERVREKLVSEQKEDGLFLVRYIGEKHPFAIYGENFDVETVYRSLDEKTDPYQCEFAILNRAGADFEDANGHYKKFSEQIGQLFAHRRRKEELARLENEVADLGGIFKDLKRKANDRFNGHRRRKGKDAGALEKAGSGEDNAHGGASSHRLREDRIGHAQGGDRSRPPPGCPVA